jgi:LAO/AO transport system kinase
MSDPNKEPALSVAKGVEQPSAINLDLIKRMSARKTKDLSKDQIVEGILKGDRTVLSRAITYVESSRPEDQKLAEEIVEACLPHSGKSTRVGVTGVPGVGKSSLIEVLGVHLIENLGKRVAVLAIDPSSQVSKGSILGDKSRMEFLSANPKAYVRPSPSRGSLGGVARKTRETVLLCEAAGFDTVLIETVGVGQSESTVHSMVDFFLLLMLAGAGDELQGIKRGIMEMADLLAITKSEGANKRRAEIAKREYENALHLFPGKSSEWYPKVLLCSATENDGIKEIWEVIEAHRKQTQANGFWQRNRAGQAKSWMEETIEYALRDRFYASHAVRKRLHDLEAKVLEGKISPFSAARKLLDAYGEGLGSGA